MPRLSHRGRNKQGPSQRQLRVAETIRGILSRTFLQESFYGSSLQGVSITVSEVRISPDLKNATAFVAPLGGNIPQGFLATLNERAPHFRYAVGKELTLRHVPAIIFRLDDSFEQAKKINDLLDKVSKDIES